MTLGLEDAAAKIGPVGDLTVCLNVITSLDAKLRRRQWASLAGLSRPGGYVLVVVPALESALHVQRFADESNKIHGSDFERGLVYRGADRQKHYTREELRDIVSRESTCASSRSSGSTTPGRTMASMTPADDCPGAGPAWRDGSGLRRLVNSRPAHPSLDSSPKTPSGRPLRRFAS